MDRYESLEALPATGRLVAAIGAFDGVHRGHVALVGALMLEARARRAASTVVTFDPHPAAVLRGRAPDLLCDPDERAERLSALGLDVLVVVCFDATLADQSAETFVRRLGAGRTLAALLMTRQSAFGRGRGGTFEAMRAQGSHDGFDVVEVPTVTVGDAPISSSRIRAAIAAGRLAEASKLLGRPYAATGVVVRGDGRGRALGFPTANLAFARPVALPPDGIYAVRASWPRGASAPASAGGDPAAKRGRLDGPDDTADGVASLGVRPTFGGGERVLEVYLLDRDVDLYGRPLRVEFFRRQRGERRFGGAAQLVRQMTLDVERARRILGATESRRGRDRRLP